MEDKQNMFVYLPFKNRLINSDDVLLPVPLTVHDVSIIILFDILTQVLYGEHNTITLATISFQSKCASEWEYYMVASL